ncbi:MAG TPA: RNA polymerase sigma factor [Chthoniobacteraceae bacterium]|nr:RNA polymerase sigma factor [Chthoniobacteraceae bacterium]
MKWPYEFGTSLPTLQRDFELVVATFERPLVQFLFRFVFDQGTALDLAQETFVKAFQNLSRHDNRRAFSTWLFAIAANLAKDHARKTTRRTALFAGAAAESPHEVCFNQPDRNLDNRELGNAIEAAIASLPLLYREPLLFRHTAGLSINETAEALGTSVAVVKTRLFRARQLLQQTLGKEWLAR